jgi:protoheme IX farnesyltransferase
VLGSAFVYGACACTGSPTRRAALQLYLFSLAYLALLFGAMVVDARCRIRAWIASSQTRTSASR